MITRRGVIEKRRGMEKRRETKSKRKTRRGKEKKRRKKEEEEKKKVEEILFLTRNIFRPLAHADEDDDTHSVSLMPTLLHRQPKPTDADVREWRHHAHSKGR